METAVIHFIILGVISGLTKGAGVLPNGTLNAAVGKTVMFNVTMTPPEPIQSVNWRFGRKDIFTFGATNTTGSGYEGRITFFISTGSLELRNVALNDSGEYRVTIVTPSGSFQHGDTTLQVYGTVLFTTTLTPSENPFTSAAWQFDGRNTITFSGANITAPEYEGMITLFMSTGSPEFRNVDLSDSGGYRVFIVSQGELPKDGITRLEVYMPVSNVTATASSTDMVEFNSSVRLSCSSSGSSLSFLWMNSSSEVTVSDRVQLTDGGSTLTIVSVTRYDQGPFRCRVLNPVSNGASDPINLNISFGPENTDLKISPPQQYFEEKSNVSLMCSADSRPAALFHWFLNGDLLSDTGPELRLMNVQMSHSGNYSCRAFNTKTLLYQKSQSSSITVLEMISGASITSSTNQPVEGNSVNLTCDAAGSVFTRKWMKDGSDLSLTDNLTFYDNNRLLHFYVVKKKDRGEYSCKISNPVSHEEATYRMVVKAKTPEGKEPGDLSAGAIAGIVIACLVVLTVGAVGGYYIYTKKINSKAPPRSGNKGQEEHTYENPSLYDKTL